MLKNLKTKKRKLVAFVSILAVFVIVGIGGFSLYAGSIQAVFLDKSVFSGVKKGPCISEFTCYFAIKDALPELDQLPELVHEKANPTYNGANSIEESNRKHEKKQQIKQKLDSVVEQLATQKGFTGLEVSDITYSSFDFPDPSFYIEMREDDGCAGFGSQGEPRQYTYIRYIPSDSSASRNNLVHVGTSDWYYSYAVYASDCFDA
ncbi:hypothetical protein HY312_01400 [Candidatus Saccharibacteria bacterium]|nr:hypothetical protein [Candidatus Saccharibacteria bacterium]